MVGIKFCDPSDPLFLDICKKVRLQNWSGLRVENTIIGHSLVADKAFAKGELICDYSGEYKTVEDYEQMCISSDQQALVEKYALQFNSASGPFLILAHKESESLGHLINHCAKHQNICFKEKRCNNSRHLLFYAAKRILPGTHFLYNYGKMYKKDETFLDCPCDLLYSKVTETANCKPVELPNSVDDNWREFVPDELNKNISGIMAEEPGEVVRRLAEFKLIKELQQPSIDYSEICTIFKTAFDHGFESALKNCYDIMVHWSLEDIIGAQLQPDALNNVLKNKIRNTSIPVYSHDTCIVDRCCRNCGFARLMTCDKCSKSWCANLKCGLQKPLCYEETMCYAVYCCWCHLPRQNSVCIETCFGFCHCLNDKDILTD